ncbi:hypothetical protein GGF41_000193 [Coemansia sp. RSA 2531]|nr:hypothetical protein GGF41_000193 [Coemansia sp. RSA 2531]
MCLLKSLPALVELRSSISGPGPELEHISAEELPGYIASTYCEVGKNLQVWRINSNSCKHTSAAIDYILLLVLVCPTLWRIQLEPDSIFDSYVKIAKALESSPYSKYAPQLNRTLDIVRE